MWTASGVRVPLVLDMRDLVICLALFERHGAGEPSVPRKYLDHRGVALNELSSLGTLQGNPGRLLGHSVLVVHVGGAEMSKHKQGIWIRLQRQVVSMVGGGHA